MHIAPSESRNGGQEALDGMPLPGLLDALNARDGVVLRMDDDDLPHESASGPAKSKANRSRDRYSTSGGSKTSGIIAGAGVSDCIDRIESRLRLARYRRNTWTQSRVFMECDHCLCRY